MYTLENIALGIFIYLAVLGTTIIAVDWSLPRKRKTSDAV